MNKKSKTITLTITCIVLALIIIVTFAIYNSKENIKQNNNIYQTATVKKGDIKVSVSATGIAIPKNKINPNYNDLQFQLIVDEIDVVKLKKNQTVNVDLNAFPDKVFKGKITYISNIGDTVNGITTYNVIVSLAKNINGLKSGMTGTGTITTENKKNVLYVPIEAINQNDSGDNYLINPSNNEQVKVITGIHNDDYIEIKQGISEGDEVQLPTLVKHQTNGFPPMMNK